MKTKLMMGGAALVAVMLTGLTTMAMADRMGRGGDGPFAMLDFAAINADKDGKITKAEVEAHRAGRVAALEVDKDGKLSGAELKAQAMERAGSRAEEMVAKMIERHDSEGDGLVSVTEMVAGPSHLAMFDRIDSDGDGAISAEEAEAVRQHMAKRIGKHRGHGGPDKGPQN